MLSSENSRTFSYKTDRRVSARISACSRQSDEFSTLGDADMRTRMTAETFCWRKLQVRGRDEEACDMAESVMRPADGRWSRNDSFSSSKSLK